MRKFLDIQMDFSKFQDNIKRVIEHYLDTEKMVERELKIFPDKIEKRIQDQVEIELANHDIRTRADTTKDIIHGFKVSSATNKGSIQLAIYHDFFNNGDVNYLRRSTGSVQDIKGSQIMKLLNYGRKKYTIPNLKTYTGNGKVLIWDDPRGHHVKVWRYGKMKFPIEVKKKSKKFGIHFLEKIPIYVNEFIDTLRDKIKEKLYRG